MAGIDVRRRPSVRISRRVVCDDVKRLMSWLTEAFCVFVFGLRNGCGDKDLRQCCTFIIFGDSKHGKK